MDRGEERKGERVREREVQLVDCVIDVLKVDV